MSKTVLKVTEGKAVVKCYGTMNDTITLNSDLVAATEMPTSGASGYSGFSGYSGISGYSGYDGMWGTGNAGNHYGVPTVDIIGMHWSGLANSVITIKRNNVIIAELSCTVPGSLDFRDKDFRDTVNNTSDIVVTSTGSAQLWLYLRKGAGYVSKVETAQFGPYDNTTLIGR